MDADSLLAAYDEQVRRHPQPDTEHGRIERDDRVVRCVSDGPGWNGVAWTDLDDTTADEVIAEQIERFAQVPDAWEWKHHSYDRPTDLEKRLLAAGFTPQPRETVLAVRIADLPADLPAPDGVHLVPVTDAAGAQALVDVHDQVFGGDHAELGRTLQARLGHEPSTAAAVVAYAGNRPVAAGRVEFHLGTEFASLWGGGTVPDWRGRGVFRALVAHRANTAAVRGFRYLQVDASRESRPILGRLGFIELTTTTPYLRSGRPGPRRNGEGRH